MTTDERKSENIIYISDTTSITSLNKSNDFNIHYSWTREDEEPSDKTFRPTSLNKQLMNVVLSGFSTK